MADQVDSTNPLAGASDLTSLINLIKGSSTTTTQGPNAAGMQALLQNILSGTSGLSAVTSGAKSAGGYNSSAQTLMTNDFLTRAAAQVAANSSTSTKSTKAPLGGSDLLTMAALFGGKSLLGPTVSAGAKKLGVDNLGESLKNAIFGAPTDTATSSIGNGAEAFDAGYSWEGIGGGASAGFEAGTMGAGADAFDAGTASLSLGSEAGAGLETFAAGAGETDFWGGLLGSIGDIFSTVGADAALEESPWLLAAL
jgi:hypothetical protein